MKKLLNRFGILLVSVLMLAGGLMPVKAGKRSASVWKKIPF